MQMTASMASVTKMIRANRNIPVQAVKKITAEQKGIRQDTLSISRSGQSKKTASSNLSEILETLNQQKEAIKETKNTFIKETLDAGKTLKSVDVQLKNFDKQIQTVDEMMATAISQEQQKKLDEETKTQVKTPVEAAPKTKEDVQGKKLNDVISMSNDIKNAETISLLKTRTEGYANFIRIQMEYDSAVPATSAPKEDLLTRVEQSIATMSQVISRTLGEAQSAAVKAPEKETESEEETPQTMEQAAKISLYEKVQNDTTKEEEKPTFEAVV